MRGKRFALSVMGALVLAVAAPAQLVIGPDSLQAGGDAHISYSDPSRAGLNILVEIDNSSPLNPLYDSVIIQLDGNGEGSADWHIPEGGWSSATFTAPGAPSMSMPVNTAPPSPPPPPTPPAGQTP